MTIGAPVREASGWLLDLTDARVTQVQIDFALGFSIFVEPNEYLFVRLETDFEYVMHGESELVEWDEPAQLGRFSELHGASVERIDVKESGRLTVFFRDGRRIHASPHENYEAYQVGSQQGVGAGGWLLVALPGGGVRAWTQ